VQTLDLRQRVKSFINDTGATVTSFCKKIDISPTYYYKWINNNVEFSDQLISRINNFLNEVYAK
jgi:transposase-like protein